MDMEKRAHPRVDKTFPVVIHLPKYEQNIKTINVSIGGAAICHSQKYYRTNQLICLELLISEGNSIITDARIRWISPTSIDAKMYKLGIEFVGMSDADKEKLKAAIKG